MAKYEIDDQDMIVIIDLLAEYADRIKHDEVVGMIHDLGEIETTVQDLQNQFDTRNQ